MLWCNQTDKRWAGIGFSILLVLLWLPFDVYRKRREWLVALPGHVVIALGASLGIILMAHDKELGGRSERWSHLLFGFLSALFGWIQFKADRVLERRSGESMRELLETRRRAPKHKPVMRFAGRPR